jgi:hypothetical protein
MGIGLKVISLLKVLKTHIRRETLLHPIIALEMDPIP